jgi:uncharacterized RDD family membrane protein YckC
MTESQLIKVASWKDRFLAGAIDHIILTASVAVPLHLTNYEPLMVCPSLALYGYYVLTEFKYGQTLGKKALHIKTTKLDGAKITLKQSALNSIGKTFLLPLDFVVGILLEKKRKQRLFNRLSETIVIKIEDKAAQKPD